MRLKTFSFDILILFSQFYIVFKKKTNYVNSFHVILFTRGSSYSCCCFKTTYTFTHFASLFFLLQFFFLAFYVFFFTYTRTHIRRMLKHRTRMKRIITQKKTNVFLFSFSILSFNLQKRT